MHWQKMINVWQGCLDPAREWFAIRRAEQWIKPDQTMAVTFQQIHIAAIPAITDDQYHCTATEYASSSFKLLLKEAQARTSSP